MCVPFYVGNLFYAGTDADIIQKLQMMVGWFKGECYNDYYGKRSGGGMIQPRIYALAPFTQSSWSGHRPQADFLQ